MSKAQVLKITKPDKTVHVVPLQNEPFLLSRNNLLPNDQKWKIERISESEAENVPFIDVDYVTGAEAVEKNSQLKKQVDDQASVIEELRRQLQAKGQTITGDVKDASADGKKTSDDASKKTSDDADLTAPEVIEKIKNATTVAEVRQLIKGDERKTVNDAAEKKIAELKG